MTIVEVSVAEMIVDAKNTKEEIKRIELEVYRIRERMHEHANEITKMKGNFHLLNKNKPM